MELVLLFAPPIDHQFFYAQLIKYVRFPNETLNLQLRNIFNLRVCTRGANNIKWNWCDLPPTIISLNILRTIHQYNHCFKLDISSIGKIPQMLLDSTHSHVRAIKLKETTYRIILYQLALFLKTEFISNFLKIIIGIYSTLKSEENTNAIILY